MSLGTLRCWVIGFCGFLLASCSGGEGDSASTAAVPADAVIELTEVFHGFLDPIALRDVHGVEISSEQFKGKLSIVYFGFATCPDVCPLALGTLSAALQSLKPTEQAQLQAMFITVDPERDTPEKLKAYLSFEPLFQGFSGSVAQIETAKAAFKVYAEEVVLENSALDYSINHTSLYYLVLPDGRAHLAIRDTVSPDQLAAILRRNIE